jgi:hypothetical protein
MPAPSVTRILCLSDNIGYRNLRISESVSHRAKLCAGIGVNYEFLLGD